MDMQEAAAVGRMPVPAREGDTALERHFGIARSAPAASPGQPSMPRVPSPAPFNSGNHLCHTHIVPVSPSFLPCGTGCMDAAC